MRLMKYIKEDVGDFISIQEFLEKDCSEILDFYFDLARKAPGDWNLMFRSVKHSVSDIKMFTPRTDRKPLDMDPKFHEVFDKLFYEKFGWKARSEGTFASFFVPAHEYGTPYFFFPFDGYKFLYNPKITDLWVKIPLAYNEEDTDEELERRFKKFVDGYKDDDLFEAWRTGCEIMFKCRHYYLVNTRWSRELKEFIYEKSRR